MTSYASGIDFANIQGNILGGFLKDHRMMLYLEFTNAASARHWLGDMVCNISSSEEVIAFNKLFKLIRKTKRVEGVVKATWTNLAFTHSGLKALGVSDYNLGQFPQEFRNGMAASAADLGDTGASAPGNWIAPFTGGGKNVHAVLIIESDDIDDLHATIAAYKTIIAAHGGVQLFSHEQAGATLPHPLTGHEHFGFKDGISQPGIRGVDTPDDPSNPNQGHPGQDLLHPGEFVLGYPTQIGTPDPSVDGPNPNPGPISENGPRWTKDGSYLVFRRLAQDVPNFHAQVQTLTDKIKLAVPQITKEYVGGKLVGRYPSGCPMEKLKSQTGDFTPSFPDPGKAAGNDDFSNNFFEYGGDPLGELVPRAAHIRKAYPRDQEGTVASGTDTESRTQTHRLLRRGLPFGAPIGSGLPGDSAADSRGLLFLCYQRDIKDQFEFVQTAWVNDASFPCPAAAGVIKEGSLVYTNGQAAAGVDGEDPIIATSAAGPYFLSDADSAINQRIPSPPATTPELNHYVTTTGGDYFFSPSISALAGLAADEFHP